MRYLRWISTFAFALSVGVGCVSSSDEDAGDDVAATASDELDILPDNCCILKFGDRDYTCSDGDALKIVAVPACKSAGNSVGASSTKVKGGRCSKYDECPQYKPPAPPSPPRRNSQGCFDQDRCCGRNVNGKCDDFCAGPKQACP